MIYSSITNLMVMGKFVRNRKTSSLIHALAFWLFYAISIFSVVYSFVGLTFIPFNFDIVLWTSIAISLVLFLVYSISEIRRHKSGKRLASLIISAIVTFLFGFAIGHTVEATVARSIALGIFMIYAPLLMFRLAGIALYPSERSWIAESYKGNLEKNRAAADNALRVIMKWKKALEVVWVILCLAMLAFVGFAAYKMFF